MASASSRPTGWQVPPTLGKGGYSTRDPSAALIPGAKPVYDNRGGGGGGGSSTKPPAAPTEDTSSLETARQIAESQAASQRAAIQARIAQEREANIKLAGRSYVESQEQAAQQRLGFELSRASPAQQQFRVGELAKSSGYTPQQIREGYGLNKPAVGTLAQYKEQFKAVPEKQSIAYPEAEENYSLIEGRGITKEPTSFELYSPLERARMQFLFKGAPVERITNAEKTQSKGYAGLYEDGKIYLSPTPADSTLPHEIGHYYTLPQYPSYLKLSKQSQAKIAGEGRKALIRQYGKVPATYSAKQYPIEGLAIAEAGLNSGDIFIESKIRATMPETVKFIEANVGKLQPASTAVPVTMAEVISTEAGGVSDKNLQQVSSISSYKPLTTVELEESKRLAYIYGNKDIFSKVYGAVSGKVKEYLPKSKPTEAPIAFKYTGAPGVYTGKGTSTGTQQVYSVGEPRGLFESVELALPLYKITEKLAINIDPDKQLTYAYQKGIPASLAKAAVTSEEFILGAERGIVQKPIQTAVTAAEMYAFPWALRGAGLAADYIGVYGGARTVSGVSKVAFGIGGGVYGVSAVSRIAGESDVYKGASKAGEITSTELLPMYLGGKLGARDVRVYEAKQFLKGYEKTLKEMSPEEFKKYLESGENIKMKDIISAKTPEEAYYQYQQKMRLIDALKNVGVKASDTNLKESIGRLKPLEGKPLAQEETFKFFQEMKGKGILGGSVGAEGTQLEKIGATRRPGDIDYYVKNKLFNEAKTAERLAQEYSKRLGTTELSGKVKVSGATVEVDGEKLAEFKSYKEYLRFNLEQIPRSYFKTAMSETIKTETGIRVPRLQIQAQRKLVGVYLEPLITGKVRAPKDILSFEQIEKSLIQTGIRETVGEVKEVSTFRDEGLLGETTSKGRWPFFEPVKIEVLKGLPTSAKEAVIAHELIHAKHPLWSEVKVREIVGLKEIGVKDLSGQVQKGTFNIRKFELSGKQKPLEIAKKLSEKGIITLRELSPADWKRYGLPPGEISEFAGIKSAVGRGKMVGSIAYRSGLPDIKVQSKIAHELVHATNAKKYGKYDFSVPYKNRPEEIAAMKAETDILERYNVKEFRIPKGLKTLKTEEYRGAVRLGERRADGREISLKDLGYKGKTTFSRVKPIYLNVQTKESLYLPTKIKTSEVYPSSKLSYPKVEYSPYTSKTPPKFYPAYPLPATEVYPRSLSQYTPKLPPFPPTKEVKLYIPPTKRKAKKRISLSTYREIAEPVSLKGYDVFRISKRKPQVVARGLYLSAAKDVQVEAALKDLTATTFLRQSDISPRDISTSNEFKRLGYLFRSPVKTSRYSDLGINVIVQRQRKVGMGRGRLSFPGEVKAIQQSRMNKIMRSIA